jgi:hypothetical protein
MSYTRDELEQWQGKPLDDLQVKFERFLVPIGQREGSVIHKVLCCVAFCKAEYDRKNYPIPPEVQERIYGQLVEGLTLKDFSIHSLENQAEEWFCFNLSANYNLAPKPPTREKYTSAKDVEDWMQYVFAISGQTVDDLLTQEEFGGLVDEQSV